MGTTRNPLYIVIAVVVVIVAIGLSLLFFATSSDAPPAAAPSQSPEPVPSVTAGTPTSAPEADTVTASEGDTSLNIAVANCENCQVIAQPTQGSTDLQLLSATVADGVAQLDMPTSTTLGLVFSIRGENDGVDLSNDKLVTLAAAGATPGAPQSQEQVAAADSAQYCWAGTTLDVATIRFTVSGSNASPEAAWADPALPTTSGGKTKLTSGSAAVPEELACGN